MYYSYQRTFTQFIAKVTNYSTFSLLPYVITYTKLGLDSEIGHNIYIDLDFVAFRCCMELKDFKEEPIVKAHWRNLGYL